MNSNKATTQRAPRRHNHDPVAQTSKRAHTLTAHYCMELSNVGFMCWDGKSRLACPVRAFRAESCLPVRTIPDVVSAHSSTNESRRYVMKIPNMVSSRQLAPLRENTHNTHSTHTHNRMVCSSCGQSGHNILGCPARQGQPGVGRGQRQGRRQPRGHQRRRQGQRRQGRGAAASTCPPEMKRCPGDRIRHGYDNEWKRLPRSTTLNWEQVRAAPDVIMSNAQAVDLMIGEDMRKHAECVVAQALRATSADLNTVDGCLVATLPVSTVAFFVERVNSHLRAADVNETHDAEFLCFLAVLVLRLAHQTSYHGVQQHMSADAWGAAPSYHRYRQLFSCTRLTFHDSPCTEDVRAPFACARTVCDGARWHDAV